MSVMIVAAAWIVSFQCKLLFCESVCPIIQDYYPWYQDIDREITKVFVFVSLIAYYEVHLIFVKFNFHYIHYHINYTYLVYT